MSFFGILQVICFFHFKIFVSEQRVLFFFLRDNIITKKKLLCEHIFIFHVFKISNKRRFFFFHFFLKIFQRESALFISSMPLHLKTHFIFFSKQDKRITKLFGLQLAFPTPMFLFYAFQWYIQTLFTILALNGWTS
jgi:hypothetical protein